MTETAKYNLEQLIKIRDGLNMMLMLREMVPAAIERSQNIQEVLSSPGFIWANDYLKSPQELMRRNAPIMGMQGIVERIESLPDKESQATALLKILPTNGPINLPQVDMSKAAEGLAWGQISMKMLDAIFTYGQDMPSLIRAAINGNDEALCKAVSIDRAVQEIPEIAARIRKAEAANQVDFLNDFHQVMQGPSGHIKLDHPLLRYFLWTLKGEGILDQLGFEERYQLFCVELEVYPNDGKDPAGSLNTFIDRWKKSLST